MIVTVMLREWTYQLLRGAHGGPATLALLLDRALGGTGAEISGDDGARGLHVQEVGRERAPGRIGVKGALLALLLHLLRRRGNGLGRGDAAQDGQVGLEVGKRLIEAQIISGGGEPKEKVGLAQIVISK